MSANGQCPKCNATNTYSKVVCDFCGARLPWADAVQKPTATPVMQSKEPETEQEKFYRQQNEKLAQQTPANDAKKLMGCFLLLGLAVLALALLAAAFAFFGSLLTRH